MIVAIHGGRSFRPDSQPYIQEMLDYLASEGIFVKLSQIFWEFLNQNGVKTRINHIYTDKDNLGEADFFVSVGGDGTLLESITYIAQKQIPILGVNTGRLGFLATISPPDIIPALQQVLKGFYKIEERTLVKVESDKLLFGGTNFGLNEFTITKRDTSSMIIIHTYIDGEFLNSYWADGLIVATPTGSTGYSLSCGGPVVLPQSRNFIIAPVSPHNLTVRPMIVSDDSVISFAIEGRGKNFLVSLDSRSEVIDAQIQIAVRKEDFLAKLITFNEHNFLNTLRTKLNWGLDIRN